MKKKKPTIKVSKITCNFFVFLKKKEEKRALLSKYIHVNRSESDPLRTQVQQLDQSLDDRLSNLEGKFSSA